MRDAWTFSTNRSSDSPSTSSPHGQWTTCMVLLRAPHEAGRPASRARRLLVLLCGRGDVLVEAEEVGWVVGVFQRDEPLVGVVAVGFPDSLFAFVVEVVDVDRVGRERLHRLEEGACPGDVGLGVGGLVPERGDEQVVRPAAV